VKHDLQRPVRAILSAVLLALMALTLAACGGSGASTNGLAPRSGGFRGSAAFSQFAKCLSKHGVNLPAFGGGGAPPNGPPSGLPPSGGFRRNQTPAQREAFQACSSLLPQGGFGGGGAGPTGGVGPTNGAGATGGTT